MVDRPRSRPKQASKQLFLQCVITCDLNTYNLRTLQALLQSTDIHSRRRYTAVHRTPYSGSPGA